MSKPSWEDAPDWATCFSQDQDGKWFWYKNMPTLDDGVWRPDGKFEKAIVRYPDCAETLEFRPEQPK